MRRILKRALRTRGYEVRRIGRVGRPVTPGEILMAMMLHNRINTVLDVGANAGQFGASMREIGYTGRIISFEPLSAAFVELRRKAQDDGNWTAHQLALGSADGEAWINVASNSYSSSILPMLESHRRAAPNSEYVGQERVRVATLDSVDWFREGDRTMLKMDTQGYEHVVLEGARQTLTRVSLIQSELSLLPLYSGQHEIGGMIRVFAELGFRPVHFEREFVDNATGYSLQVNGVFCRADTRLETAVV